MTDGSVQLLVHGRNARWNAMEHEVSEVYTLSPALDH